AISEHPVVIDQKDVWRGSLRDSLLRGPGSHLAGSPRIRDVTLLERGSKAWPSALCLARRVSPCPLLDANRRTPLCDAYASRQRRRWPASKMPASPSGSFPATSLRIQDSDSRLISETTSAFVEATHARFPSGAIKIPTGAGLFPSPESNRFSDPDTAS